jgi:hypothetical protein
MVANTVGLLIYLAIIKESMVANTVHLPVPVLTYLAMVRVHDGQFRTPTYLPCNNRGVHCCQCYTTAYLPCNYHRVHGSQYRTPAPLLHN